MKCNHKKSKQIYLFTLLDLRTVDFFFLRFGGSSSVESDCLSEVTVISNSLLIKSKVVSHNGSLTHVNDLLS